MSRVFRSRRERETEQPLDETATELSGSSGSGLRKALAGLGLAVLAFLAARRVRKRDGAPSMDEVRETVDDVRSGNGFDIPIGETGESTEGAGATPRVGTGTTQGAIGNEPMPGEDLSSGASGERAGEEADEGAEAEAEPEAEAETEAEAEPEGEAESEDEELPPDAIDERAEEDAHGAPTEPGEMAVDEELAEDVADEDQADAETGETGTDETRATEDETASEGQETSEGETGEEDRDGDEGEQVDESA